jgi:hypothetical protein
MRRFIVCRIMEIKSRRMIETGHGTYMGEMKNAYNF